MLRVVQHNEIGMLSNNKTSALLLVLLIGVVIIIQTTTAAVACNDTSTCVELLREGSECIDGYCNNPFQEGCLRRILGTENFKKRTCNSDDPPGAAEQGLCSQPENGLEYMEIRIMSQNWESAFFEAWLLQIILSELLDVPVTLETGTPDAKISFYDPMNAFQYGTANDFDSIRTSLEIGGDCRLLKKQQSNPQEEEQDEDNDDESKEEEYRACAHVFPEVWSGQIKVIQELEQQGMIEPPQFMGVIGRVGWYIPKFVAKEFPSLTSSLGMYGEDNRRTLAKLFNRPTTWKDYCDLVSPNGCSSPDDVAQRAPADATENNRMFVEGVYNGYFRATEKNDCDKNPNCTGHVADFPCGWTSFLRPQALYNQIAVESDGPQAISRGYTYSQLTEMWAAANATKTNILQYWWTPEALYEQYINTDAEFQRITLPVPTQDCIDNRLDMEARCSENIEDRLGEPEGACDNEAEALKRVIVSNLYELTNEGVPEALISPAYDVITGFVITDLQIGKIFEYWLQRKIDKWNFDPREATCQWAAENLDLLRTFVPRTHPRTIRRNQKYLLPLFYIATMLGLMAICLVLVCFVITHKKRSKRAIRHAQVEFLYLLLSGLLMVSVGSFVLALGLSDSSCVLIQWLLSMGYTLEMVPLIVKVAAMNRLMSAARRMKRVKLNKRKLFETVFSIFFFVVMFLVAWTVVDPPRKEIDLDLTGEITKYGATVIDVRPYCRSDNRLWRYISIAWHSLLLITAVVLAVQNRKFRRLRRELNESQVLPVMIYSHFVFVALRIITILMESSWPHGNINESRSIVFSLDVIVTVNIYFIPKFVAKEREMGTWISNAVPRRVSLAASRMARSSMALINQLSSKNTDSRNTQNPRSDAVTPQFDLSSSDDDSVNAELPESFHCHGDLVSLSDDSECESITDAAVTTEREVVDNSHPSVESLPTVRNVLPSVNEIEDCESRDDFGITKRVSICTKTELSTPHQSADTST